MRTAQPAKAVLFGPRCRGTTSAGGNPRATECSLTLAERLGLSNPNVLPDQSRTKGIPSPTNRTQIARSACPATSGPYGDGGPPLRSEGRSIPAGVVLRFICRLSAPRKADTAEYLAAQSGCEVEILAGESRGNQVRDAGCFSVSPNQGPPITHTGGRKGQRYGGMRMENNMSEQKRQQMVMMGPGFMSSGGSIFGPMIAFAIGGWAIAVVVGICWWLFG